MDTTGVARRRLSREEARALTDEVKSDAQALWAKLLRLYEGGAHIALGYSSWEHYGREEFGYGKSQAYALVDAGRVMKALEEHSAVAERPASEGVARELASVVRNEGSEKAADIWEKAVAAHGPTPTAKELSSVVEDPEQAKADREYAKKVANLTRLSDKYRPKKPAPAPPLSGILPGELDIRSYELVRAAIPLLSGKAVELAIEMARDDEREGVRARSKQMLIQAQSHLDYVIEIDWIWPRSIRSEPAHRDYSSCRSRDDPFGRI